ncbi:SH3 domain-containing protein [Lasiosphaeria ovina]|uniref:SH3 domain-containing protein n=1 Tax=Lasiosphaeria ovina TaxID=92902 RepID=A0AAE0NFK5_9PEZI|nr:SH3 domain-containing protein [Lasiosphaeria ovina]
MPGRILAEIAMEEGNLIAERIAIHIDMAGRDTAAENNIAPEFQVRDPTTGDGRLPQTEATGGNGVSVASDQSATAPTPDPAQAIANAEESHAEPAPTATAAVPPTPPITDHWSEPWLRYARVLYDFSATFENELSVVTGEIVAIVEKEMNGWWLVENTAFKCAWVPMAYLEELPAEAISRPSHAAQAQVA